MHFSIESRVPFLEPELVSYALQMPSEYKFHNGYTKYVIRKAFENDLPSNIIWQKNKLGFASPEKDILKKIYGINEDTNGSLAWRKIITNEWRSINK
jgi:asparagine synthase (glutamine-hydrolysing)